MSKFSIYSKILLNNMFNPKNLISLAKERFEVNQDSEHHNHKYEYNFNSNYEFFKNKFPNENISQYELELNEMGGFKSKWRDGFFTEKLDIL